MKKITSIAIIGAGPSAVSVYMELVRSQHFNLKNITLFDPLGLMNSSGFISPSESTLTNTSVGVTSLSYQDLMDFYKWTSVKYQDKGITATDFVPRSMVREYCLDRFHQAKSFVSVFGCTTEVIPRSVDSFSWDGSTFTVKDSTGSQHQFDALINATGVEQVEPREDLQVSDSYISNPYPETTFIDQIEPQDNVLVIGSKLSAIDVAVALGNKGANITMVSRSGKLPSVRDALLIEPDQRIIAEDDSNIDSLLTKLESFVETIENSECDDGALLLDADIQLCESGDNNWQRAIGFFVEQVNELWPMMDDSQKTKFEKLSQPFFGRYVSAFPIQNAKKLQSLIRSGMLRLAKGDVSDVVSLREGMLVGHQALEGQHYDWVINATGIMSKPLTEAFQQSYKAMGAEFNKYGGVVIDTDAMRVEIPESEVPYYLIGGAAKGELLVLNYLRSSAVQARKITDDLIRLTKCESSKLVSEVA